MTDYSNNAQSKRACVPISETDPKVLTAVSHDQTVGKSQSPCAPQSMNKVAVSPESSLEMFGNEISVQAVILSLQLFAQIPIPAFFVPFLVPIPFPVPCFSSCQKVSASFWRDFDYISQCDIVAMKISDYYKMVQSGEHKHQNACMRTAEQLKSKKW